MADARALETFARLVDVMARLRGPGGCPWDLEQTPETLRPYILEEAYEVIEAIDHGDAAQIRDELGDLLLQVVFQAQLAAEGGRFTIADVAQAITDKLERRHPHVFGDATGVSTSAEVLAQWEEIKQAEKAAAGHKKGRVLAGVKPGPALVRAQKIGNKAGKVGFDWPGWEGSFAKIEEEVGELKVAAKDGDAAAINHELGDLMFAIVNVARKLNVDAEQALVDATDRFRQRFEFVEDRLAERGKSPQTSNLDEMDALWNDAKRAGIATSGST